MVAAMPGLGETLAIATALTWSAAVILFRQSGLSIGPTSLNLFKNVVGSVTGFATTISTLGGLLSALLIGYALNESGPEGYKIAFAVASCGYLIGFAILHLLVPKMKPLAEMK